MVDTHGISTPLLQNVGIKKTGNTISGKVVSIWTVQCAHYDCDVHRLAHLTNMHKKGPGASQGAL